MNSSKISKNFPKDFALQALLPTHDIIWITLDTLRYDVAQTEFLAGHLPYLATVLPETGWEHRHSPASFTFAAHQAFFAGFLPTPAKPIARGKSHKRWFASRFAGSQSTTKSTWIFDEANMVSALAAKNFHTLCIGGVGFFNPANSLGSVLPSLFQESHWNNRFSVMSRYSTDYQVELAIKRWSELSGRIFTFINVSALHYPNFMYLNDPLNKNNQIDYKKIDSLESHAAALHYVDRALNPLWQAAKNRAPTLFFIFSDHGTAYGENGYFGHRIAHSSVWDVPYAEFLLD